MRKTEKGFTLIELIMVMVLVGIAAAIASPLFFDQTRSRAQTAALKLKSDIRYAQQLAIQNLRYTLIVFSDDGLSYSISQQNAAGIYGPVLDPQTRQNFNVIYGQGVAVNGINFAIGNAACDRRTLVFDGIGAPYCTSISRVGVFALQEPASAVLNGRYQVRVRAVTGKTDIVNL